MNHYVYEIINLMNNKKYIGKRSCHCSIEDDDYMGSGILLKKAYKKYGKDKFKKSIVKICLSSDEAYSFEKYLIEKVHAYESPMYYNIAGGGKGAGVGESHPNFNMTVSEETRARLSKALKGKPKPESQRIKLSQYHKGRHLKEETKEKLRVHFSQRYKGEGNPFYGKKHTKETREKLRQINLGKKQSEETRMKYNRKGKNNPMYGKKAELSPNSLKIICLNTNEVFECIREGAEKYGLDASSLAKCCKGNLKSCGKLDGHPLKWMYYNKYINLTAEEVESFKEYKNNCYIKVINLNTLKIFNTMSEGAVFANTTKQSISKCCKGKLNTAGKVNGERAKWMIYDDYLKFNDTPIK